MRILRTLPFVLMFAALSSGCATAGNTADASSSNSDLIASEELRRFEGQYPNAYLLVDRRRSLWLRSRRTSFGGGERILPVVYVDGTPFGPIGSLGSLQTTSIQELEFMSSIEATTYYGTGVDGGVIHVRLR